MSGKKINKLKSLPPHMKLGCDKFKFPNNDRYEGEFLADLHKKSFVRHGKYFEFLFKQCISLLIILSIHTYFYMQKV